MHGAVASASAEHRGDRGPRRPGARPVGRRRELCRAVRPRGQAQVARLTDTASLHLVRKSGNMLYEKGTATGTLPGTVSARFVTGITKVTGTVTFHPYSGGSLTMTAVGYPQSTATITRFSGNIAVRRARAASRTRSAAARSRAPPTAERGRSPSTPTRASPTRGRAPDALPSRAAARCSPCSSRCARRACSLLAAAGRGAAGPVRIAAAFDRDACSARHGARRHAAARSAPLTSAPLTEVRFAYPRSLGLVSSGLGLAACTRPASDFAQVLIVAPRLGGCSPNAVMGVRHGARARAADQRPGDPRVRDGHAAVGRVRARPARTRGVRRRAAPVRREARVRGRRARCPAPVRRRADGADAVVPGLEELATISLVEMRITIGSPRDPLLRAPRRTPRRLSPGGRRAARLVPSARLPLPGRRSSFADRSRRSAASTTPCPPAVAVAGRRTLICRKLVR